MGDGGGRDLFRYLVADETDDYFSIMTCFAEALLTDLSAADVAARVTAGGDTLDPDVAEQRCRQLVRWGNLASSGRDARVGTVTDYVRARARYRATVLGGRVHREATGLLSSREGAREVARESLGRITDALDHIHAALNAGGPTSAETLAGHVTAVFAHQREFADSITDFYAYLSHVLNRTDLSDAEYTEFKMLLLDYVDVITADVGRHAPHISNRLQELLPHLDRLLATLPDPGFPGSAEVTRSPGRTRAEWEQLAAWYDEDAAPRRLRDAAATALGRLLTHTRRFTSPVPGFSHRADLLRLAGRFAESSDAQAHQLFAAAFGAYPSRHLLLGPEEPDPRIGPGTSWWDADPVAVPVSLRERGDRSPRGRNARIPDPTADRARIDALAEQESRTRRAAVAELCAVGDLDGAQVTTAARDVLLAGLASLFAHYQSLAGPVRVDDHDLGLTLSAEPGPDTVLHCPDGALTVHALTLRASEAVFADGECRVGAR